MEASKKISVPNDELIEEALRWFDRKDEVVIRAKGRSMHPYIKDGVDELVFVRADSTKVKVGDVVLGRTTRGNYVVHRVIRIAGETVTLMGDGNLYGTEQCRAADIRALLVAIERRGRRIDVNTRYQRLKASLMRTLYRIPRKIYARLRGRARSKHTT